MGDKFKKQILEKFTEERDKSNGENLNSINDFEIETQQTKSELLKWTDSKGSKGGQNCSTLLHGKAMFNDEDLLFLNRVAFMSIS